MFKLVVLVSLMILGVAWCSCDACGQECTRACGTRRFRACCFNYLRKKRTQEIYSLDAEEGVPKMKKPVVIIKYLPEEISSDFYDSWKIPSEIQNQMIDV